MQIALSCSELPSDVAKTLNVLSVADTALKQFLCSVINALADNLTHKGLGAGLNPGDYSDVPFPGADRAVPIGVVLVPSQEAFAKLGVTAEDPTSAFLLSKSMLDDTGESSGFACGLRVVALCDEAHFLEFMRWQHEGYSDDGGLYFNATSIRTYVSDLVGEVVRAVDFATHGRGLTPARVDAAYRAGHLDKSVMDVLTGRGIRPEMTDAQWANEELAVEEAQARAEELAVGWLIDCLQGQTPASYDLRLSELKLCDDVAATLDLLPQFVAPAPCVA